MVVLVKNHRKFERLADQRCPVEKRGILCRLIRKERRRECANQHSFTTSAIHLQRRDHPSIHSPATREPISVHGPHPGRRRGVLRLCATICNQKSESQQRGQRHGFQD